MFSSLASRYSSLKRSLLADESDGPTEDTTHISRVLRQYYTEKGRAFPPWLPPDPSSAPSRPQVYSYGSSNSDSGTSGGASNGGGLLSDLFDSSPNQRQQPPQPTSLRRRPGDSGGGGGPSQRPGLRAGAGGGSGYLAPAARTSRGGYTGGYSSSERSRSYTGAHSEPSEAQKSIFTGLWGNMVGKGGATQGEAAADSTGERTYGRGGGIPPKRFDNRGYGDGGGGGRF